MRAALLAAAALLAWPAGRARGAGARAGGQLRLARARRRAARRSRAAVRGRAGRARAARQGRREAGPALRRPRLRGRCAGGERGLLSIAFPPDYAASGLAYVYLTARRGRDPDPRAPALRRTRTARSPRPGRVVLAIPHTEPATTTAASSRSGRTGCSTRASATAASANDTTSLRRREPRLAARQDPAHRPAPGRRAAYSVPAGNPFAHAGLGVRAAQPVALLVRPRHGRPVRRGRRPGRASRRSTSSLRARRGANFGWRCWEGSIRTPTAAHRNSPRWPAAPAARVPVIEHEPRGRLVLDHRRLRRARSRRADRSRAATCSATTARPACCRRCPTAAAPGRRPGSASAG